MNDKLGSNLDTLMSENKLTANKVASQTGIPASTIKKIRSSVITNPTLATLVPLVNYFSVTLDQMLYGDDILGASATSFEVMKKLPIISWSEAIVWPNQSASNPSSFVMSEVNFTSEAFALRVEADNWALFPSHGLLLIEPNGNPKHEDCVLIHEPHHASPTVNAFLTINGTNYLRELVPSQHVVPLSDHFRILGIVVEYRKSFKKLHLD